MEKLILQVMVVYVAWHTCEHIAQTYHMFGK